MNHLTAMQLWVLALGPETLFAGFLVGWYGYDLRVMFQRRNYWRKRREHDIAQAFKKASPTGIFEINVDTVMAEKIKNGKRVSHSVKFDNAKPLDLPPADTEPDSTPFQSSKAKIIYLDEMTEFTPQQLAYLKTKPLPLKPYTKEDQ